MAERLILHIGVQKSGTTYLQQMMQERVEELAAIGVLYPLPRGKHATRIRENHHEIASYGLLGTEIPWVTPERQLKHRGWWEELCRQVREWPGTAVVSAEALAVIRADAGHRIIEAFGVPANTDVFITARGLGKLLSSSWQQRVRNGAVSDFGSVLQTLAAERERGWDAIEKEPQGETWRKFAIARLARRWASIVGLERVTLITNPGSPSDLLWRRYLDAADLGDTSGFSAPDPGTVVHSGVTAAEAEVLRSVNASLLSAGWPRDTVRRLGKQIARAWIASERRGPRVGIPRGFRTHVDRWSREDLAELRESDLRIVGDVDELAYSPDAEPPEPTAADVAAAAGVAALVATEWADAKRADQADRVPA